MAGYCVTGHVRDGVIVFAHGATACGKTTFLEALKKALADHAKTASFDTSTATKHAQPDMSTPETARLAGARSVLTTQSPWSPDRPSSSSWRATSGLACPMAT